MLGMTGRYYRTIPIDKTGYETEIVDLDPKRTAFIGMHYLGFSLNVVTLLALSLVQFDRQGLNLGFVCARFPASRHLVPPSALRWLSRRPLFHRYASQAYALLKLFLRLGNGLLRPLRWLRGGN